MLLKLDKAGRLVQASPYSDDGEGHSIPTFGVLQENVFVQPADIIQQQKNAQTRAQILNARKQFVRNQRAVQAQANAMADQVKRTAVMNGQIDAPTREEFLIRNQVHKDKFGNADFSQFEQVRAAEDFGSYADFQTYSTYGNPLTPDGSIGPVTDYERFVLADQFAMPIGVLSDPNSNTPMGTMLDIKMPRKLTMGAHRPALRAGRNSLAGGEALALGEGSMAYPTMVKYGLTPTSAKLRALAPMVKYINPKISLSKFEHPMSGRFGALGDDSQDLSVYTGGDASLDSLLDDPNATSLDTSQQASVQASQSASPSFWSSLAQSAVTAAPSLLSNLTKSSGAVAVAAKAPVAAAPASTAMVTIPFTSVKISQTTALLGGLALGVGVYFMIKGVKTPRVTSAAAVPA